MEQTSSTFSNAAVTWRRGGVPVVMNRLCRKVFRFQAGFNVYDNLSSLPGGSYCLWRGPIVPFEDMIPGGFREWTVSFYLFYSKNQDKYKLLIEPY